jgi:hypothetical protein
MIVEINVLSKCSDSTAVKLTNKEHLVEDASTRKLKISRANLSRKFLFMFKEIGGKFELFSRKRENVFKMIRKAQGRFYVEWFQ